MSNNNTPSKAEAMEALDYISREYTGGEIRAVERLRAFVSGAPDNQPQGELNATRLDTNDRATAGNRGARPDLQHIARDGHEPGSSCVESHPLRGGDGMVVGDITPSTRPGCAGVHLPLDASAASAPLGWLYDWTHSSALGKPDEHFTGFTTDETYARKHDNPRPVWGSPDAPNAGQPVVSDVRELANLAHAQAEHYRATGEALPGFTPAADESTRAPDGWRLVPVEPTSEMIVAFLGDDIYPAAAFERRYTAMLRAVPPSGERTSAPAPEGEKR